MDGTHQKLTRDAADPSNPSQQDVAIKTFDKASKLFGSTRDNITPEMLYASTYVDPDMNGSYEVEDWDTLLKQLSVPEKQLGMESKRIAMQKAIKDMADSNMLSGLDTLNKMLTVLSKIQNTGAIYQDDMKKTIQQVFKGLGWTIDQEQFNKMWQGSFLNKIGQGKTAYDLLMEQGTQGVDKGNN